MGPQPGTAHQFSAWKKEQARTEGQGKENASGLPTRGTVTWPGGQYSKGNSGEQGEEAEKAEKAVVRGKRNEENQCPAENAGSKLDFASRSVKETG